MKKIFLLFLGLSIMGCSTVKPAPHTGFLKDYSRLKPSDEVEGLMVEKYEHKTIGDYDKFYVEPVRVHLQPNSKAQKVEIDKIKDLAQLLYHQTRVALAEHYEVVDKPGPGVLKIRTALTDVMANKAYLNVHWTTTATGLGVGGAAIEAEFLDGKTNERIMAVVDTRKGKPFQKNIVKSYAAGWSKWGNTKDVFDQWVGLLVGKLNELHGITTVSE